jgi:archaetidylinositol phosphate synthase
MTLRDNGQPKLRINQISLGPFERRVLPWLAARLPRWVVPDHLTFLGLFGALVIGVSYMLTHYSYDWLWMASAGLVLNWFGDSLDGTLARTRKIERERYGFFMDHYTDTVAVFFICFGMGLSPLMDLRIALLLMIGYYAMMTLVYIVTLSRDVFKISFGGVGPTELRLFMIFANTVVWALKNPVFTVFGFPLTLFGFFGAFMIAFLAMLYFVFGEIERHKLAKLDPPPVKAAATETSKLRPMVVFAGQRAEQTDSVKAEDEKK